MAITWTPTVEDRYTSSGKHRARVKLVASGTYTTGGDAIPAFGALGMKRNVDYLILTDDAHASGHVYKYDQVNKKIMIYNENDAAAYAQRPQLAEIQAGTAIATTLFCEVVGW